MEHGDVSIGVFQLTCLRKTDGTCELCGPRAVAASPPFG